METASGRQSSGYLMWDYMRSVSLSSTAGNTQVLPTVVVVAAAAAAGNTLTRGQGPQTTSRQKTTLATAQPQIQLQIRCSFPTKIINNLTTL